MKKLLAVILVVILALSLSATALAAFTLPDTKNDSIKSGSHVLLKWEGDVSAIKGFIISFDIKNFDKYADSPDGADVQIVVNSDAGWVNLSAEGGVFGKANGWGNTMLPTPKCTFTYTGSFSGDWLEVGVGNWNDMEGAFTVTVFSEVPAAPSTGVVTFIGLAGAALLVSGTGAIAVARKLRKK